MLFTKQALVFSSLLLGALVSAAPVPMPIANAVSQAQPRDVQLIRAYAKRQDPTLPNPDDIVTIGDSDPVTALDGVVKPYAQAGVAKTKRQDPNIVTIGDSEPVTAPDGVVKPYGQGIAKRQDDPNIVTIGDSEPVTALDGVVKPYGQGIAKRQDDPNIVTTSDSVPATAPDGVVKTYPQPAARSEAVREMRYAKSRM